MGRSRHQVLQRAHSKVHLCTFFCQKLKSPKGPFQRDSACYKLLLIKYDSSCFLALKCHTCEDCGHAKGKEASCSPGLNRCMSKSYTSTEGKKTITKNCANTTSCHAEQEDCKTNKCKVRCCTSNLCNTATSSTSCIKRAVLCWWILGSLYALGWWL